MAWLYVDKHAAVFDSDARVQAAIAALRARLEEHSEVVLSIVSGGFNGPSFTITRDTVLSAPEASDDFDHDLFGRLNGHGARNSPSVYWYANGDGFVSGVSSRKW